MTCSVTNHLTSWANPTNNYFYRNQGVCRHQRGRTDMVAMHPSGNFLNSCVLYLLLVDSISLVRGMNERVLVSNEECAQGLMELSGFYFHKQINRLAAQVFLLLSESYIMLLSYNWVTLPTIDKYISGKRFELRLLCMEKIHLREKNALCPTDF